MTSAYSKHRKIYCYPPVHNRLLALQERMSAEKGGRQVSMDAVLEALLDRAGEREDQGA